MQRPPTTSPATETPVIGLPVLALVLANLIPLAGVLALGWDVFEVVFLYWLENVVVGIYAVAKIALAQGPAPETPRRRGGAGGAQAAMTSATRVVLVPFFCVHYGMFTLVHGIFVFALFGGDVGFGPFGGLEGGLAAMDRRWLALAFAALLGSHGLSFWRNYLAGGEYLTLSPQEAMGQPYGRVVVLHLTIIFGGMLVTFLGSPVWALVLLVALKIGLDVRAHLAERRKAMKRAEVALGAAALATPTGVLRSVARSGGKPPHEPADEEVSG
jgi:hypothetical protein